MMTNQRNALTTVVSYPERGEGGNNKYRGNCSPKLIEDLIAHFGVQEICDYMCGSNTTGDAARTMGIHSHTYDLHSGFDLLHSDIPERPQFIFWHPPYWDSTQFTQFPAMLAYHEETRKASLWERTEVNRLRVAALDKASPLYEDPSSFDSAVSQEAIADTAENLGLAIQVGERYFPLRDTAYKSLLDRVKINGTALPKLARAKLAEVLNSCLELHKDSALLLIRDEKVSAAHSGDGRDYSILEIDQLLDGLQKKMDERFPGNSFESGYSDHSITSASWILPGQKEDLLSTYEKLLEAEGKKTLAAKLMPGIRFSTSDTGVASAKVSALLMGLQYPIHIGGMVAIEHRRQSKV